MYRKSIAPFCKFGLNSPYEVRSSKGPGTYFFYGFRTSRLLR